MAFQKATKKQSKARMAIISPSGAGKTMTALRIARGLSPQGKIAVLDTERGSASKYAGVTDFDVDEDFEAFTPAIYVQKIQAAAKAGYEVLIIDSLSHAWMGKGGALEQVDRAAKKSSGNSFAAWRDVTPQHNAMVDAIVSAPMHIIATMRAKTEYVLEQNERGKMVPRKIGVAPVQRDGLEYEFDVVGEINHDHELVITKTRCPKLVDGLFKFAGEDVGGVLRDWLADGVAGFTPATAPEELPADVYKRCMDDLYRAFKSASFDDAAAELACKAVITVKHAPSLKHLSVDQFKSFVEAVASGGMDKYKSTPPAKVNETPKAA